MALTVRFNQQNSRYNEANGSSGDSVNWDSNKKYGHRIFGIGSSGSRVSKTVTAENDGENNRKKLSTWACNEQQDSNAWRTVCRTFNTSNFNWLPGIATLLAAATQSRSVPKVIHVWFCLQCLHCPWVLPVMPAEYLIKASPRHQLTTTKKRYVRQGILEYTTDIYWPIVTPLQDHTREKRNTWSGRWKDQDKLAKNTMLDYHQCPDRNITR